jgi:hypothetical protein
MVAVPGKSADVPEKDKSELKDFLTDLETFLGATITDQADLFGIHARAFDEAWPTVSARFEEVRRGIDSTERSRQDLSVDDELAAHGLRGAELAVKLEVFESALSDFLDEIQAQEDAERYWKTWAVRLRGSGFLGRSLYSRVRDRLRSVQAAGRDLLKGKFGWVVEAADVMLDSLALGFLPGVGAATGAISEFKNTAKVALFEADDVQAPVADDVSASRWTELRARVRDRRMKRRRDDASRRASGE